MAEVFTAPFLMHGARDAIANGLTQVEEQVKGLEQAVMEKPGLAFDLAKTLIESVCKAVLTERDIAYTQDANLSQLFKMATTHLPFLPSTASGEAGIRESLRKTLGGLSGAIQGICELRNQCGFASHGSGISRPAMESVQALLAAEAADAVVGFLYRVHRQDRTLPSSPQLLYDDNSKFNDSVDEAHGMIHIFDLELRPSEVLFDMEPESYRNYLVEFKEQIDGDSSEVNTSTSIAPEVDS